LPLSAGLPLPDQILVHGFLTENGRKISKSLGNSVDPLEFDTALRVLWARVARLNQGIDRTKPWEALKNGNKTGLHDDLGGWLGEFHRIALWLQPFLPAASAAIHSVISTCPIVRCTPVFPRV